VWCRGTTTKYFLTVSLKKRCHKNTSFNGASKFMFYLYVLKSKKDNQCYIGSTNDLKRRFTEHSKGLVQSTKSRRPLELIYYEAYRAEKDARHREQNLKLKSRAYTQLKKRIEESSNLNG
jgi:putative endonuclease